MASKREDIDHAFRISVIIWFVMVVSQVMFFILVVAAKPGLLASGGTEILGDKAAVVLGFAMLAATNFIVSMFVKKRAIEHAIAEKQIRYVQFAVVLGSMFCGFISFLGCVIAIGFDYPYFYAWFFFGFAGILMHFPRRADLEAAS